jgi:hypothetical protein
MPCLICLEENKDLFIFYFFGNYGPGIRAELFIFFWHIVWPVYCKTKKMKEKYTLCRICSTNLRGGLFIYSTADALLDFTGCALRIVPL